MGEIPQQVSITSHLLAAGVRESVLLTLLLLEWGEGL